MHIRYLLTSLLLLAAVVVRAEVNVTYHGDVDHDGKLTSHDAVLMAETALQKQPCEQWQLKNGGIVATVAAVGMQNLCADVNHDRQVTIADVLMLLRWVKEPEKAERIVVKDGAITYVTGTGIAFIPEDEGFIDDGELEF